MRPRQMACRAGILPPIARFMTHGTSREQVPANYVIALANAAAQSKPIYET
jgi:hypothetical protein